MCFYCEVLIDILLNFARSSFMLKVVIILVNEKSVDLITEAIWFQVYVSV
jgi:glycogen synthase